jgi:predicted phosphodiesterase
VDQHQLVVALKELAVELGRTPLRREFTAIHGHQYNRSFGGWAAFIQAAGLDALREVPKKINNSVFNRGIESHLAQYQPKPYAPPAPFPTAMVISDIHWPFSSARVLAKFFARLALKRPKFVIINGDAWDMYSHSKYPRSHNIFTPREEQRLARQMNEEFWRKVQEISPDSICVQLMGNHDVRPMKKVLEEYPEAEDWVREKLEKLFTFDGVKTFFDPREEFFLNEVTAVFHGYRSKLGDHRDYTLINCINGHTHVGGVVYRQVRGELIFEANSGVSGDPLAKGLTYTPQKITHWTPGFLELDEEGPRFIAA